MAVGCGAISRLPQDVDPARYESCDDPAGALALEQAKAMLATDRAGEALPLLREVLGVCPEHVPTHVLYQDTSRALGGEPLAEMQAYYRDLPGEPPSSVVQYMRARLLEHDATRLVALNTLLDRDPGFYNAHFSKARLLRSVEQRARSVQSFRDALEVNGELLEARLELAEVLVELRRFREAEPHYQRYVRGKPEDWGARRAYVRLLLYDLGQAKEAEEHVAALLRVNPDDPELVMDRAALAWRSASSHEEPLEKRRRFEEAETLYRQVLERDPTRARALLNLANLYYDAMSQTDLDRRRYWPMARETYRSYLRLGRPEGAMDLFDYYFAVPDRLTRIETFLGTEGGRWP